MGEGLSCFPEGPLRARGGICGTRWRAPVEETVAVANSRSRSAAQIAGGRAAGLFLLRHGDTRSEHFELSGKTLKEPAVTFFASLWRKKRISLLSRPASSLLCCGANAGGDLHFRLLPQPTLSRLSLVRLGQWPPSPPFPFTARTLSAHHVTRSPPSLLLFPLSPLSVSFSLPLSLPSFPLLIWHVTRSLQTALSVHPFLSDPGGCEKRHR